MVSPFFFFFFFFFFVDLQLAYITWYVFVAKIANDIVTHLQHASIAGDR